MILKNIVIIGCGTMGSQISVLLSVFGFQVTCITTKEKKKAYEKIEILTENPFWKRLILRNRKPEIIISNDWSPCKKADLVIEAVTEDFQTKAQIFKKIKLYISDSCLVSTITSTFSINKLSNIGNPENFTGLHFFNPVVSMKIIELIPSKTTSQSTLDTMFQLGESLGKNVVVAPDEPGFIVNKLLTPFWIDCVRYLEKTNSCPEKINEVIKQGANLPIGPFEIIDLIGIDMFCKGADSLYDQTQDPRYKIPDFLIDLIEKEKLGRKTGEGILSYSGDDS